MITLSLPTQAAKQSWLVGVAWVAMLLMSRLPQIVLREFFAIEASFVGLWLGIAAVLLAATYLWPGMKPLRGYLWIMAAMALITGPCDMLLRHSPLWATWFSPERGWPISFLGERLPLVVEALILMLMLIGMGMKGRDFFLAVGNLRAAATGLPLLRFGNAWLVVGPFWALLLTLLFFFGTAAMTGTRLSELPRVLPWLPVIVLFALLNAFGEEFVYRAAPLSQLAHVVGRTQAIWLTAVWFGLGHYYGGIPSGPVGALMAGGIALLYGKALVETRGILLPTLMHMVTDVAIYLFLALGAMGM
ncbi:MAG: CPBP family intramembrane glutamic endopeptidase [Caldilineaceae bacterium]